MKSFKSISKKILVYLLLLSMFTQLFAGICIENVKADYNMGDVTILDSTLLINGSQYQEGTVVSEGAVFKLVINWTVNNQVTPGSQIKIKLPDCIDFNEIIGANLNGNGISGTYDVKDGYIIVTPTEELSSNVVGHNEIEGKLNSSYRPTEDVENKSLNIFDKTYNVKIAKTQETSALSISKYCDGSYDPAKGQKYVITVSSQGKNSRISINDVFDTSLMELNGDVTVTSSKGTTLDAAVTATSNGFNVELDSSYTMTHGETLTFTYYAKLKDSVNVTGTTGINNKAKVSSKEAAAKEADCWLSLSKSWVKKSASLHTFDDSSDNDYVDWTIEVNSGFPYDIEGYTFSDVIPDEFTLTSDVTIKDKTTGSVLAVLDKNSVGSNIKYTFTGTSESTYLITYRTSVDKSKLNKDIINGDYSDNNTAVLTDNTTEIGRDSAYIRYPGVGNLLNKTYESFSVENQKGVILWKTVIEIPEDTELRKHLTLKDTVNQSAWNGINQELLSGSFSVTKDGAEISDSLYTLTSDKYSFSIDFNSLLSDTDITGQIVVTYKTCFNLIDSQASVINSCNLSANNKNISDSSATYNYVPVVKKVFRGNTTDSGNINTIFAWGLTINLEGKDEEDVIYITEKLPENNILDEASVVAWNNEYYDGTPSADGISVYGYDSESNTVKIKIELGKVRKCQSNTNIIFLRYNTIIDDLSEFLMGGTKKYVNEVTVSDSKNNILGGATASTDNITPPKDKVLSKRLERYDAYTAPYATFAIDVNTSGATLLDGKTMLTLTDKLGNAITYAPGTFKVYLDSAKTTLLPESSYKLSYNSESNILTVKLPDSTPCYIVYDVKIKLTPGEEFSDDENSSNYGGNKVSLTGLSGDTVTKEASITGVVSSSAGYITSEFGSLELYKYDSQISDSDVPVPGAAYTADIAYCMDAATGEVIEATDAVLSQRELSAYKKGTTYTTDSDGHIKFNNLYYDYLYCIREVTAPSGYLINSKPIYVYIVGHDNSDYKNSALLNALNIEALEYPNSDIIFVTDDKAPAELKYISISKKILNEDTELSGAVFELIENGNVILTWTSQNSPRKFYIDNGSSNNDVSDILLKAGTEYTVREISAPAGYNLADPVTFKVNADGIISTSGEGNQTGTLTIRDERIININKIADNTASLLAGAALRVYEKDDISNVIASWTSTQASQVLKVSQTDRSGYLTINKIYVLEETKAPSGYKLSDKVYFKVDADGAIIITDADGNAASSDISYVSSDKATLSLINNYLVQLKIVKTDLSGNILSGAEFALYKVVNGQTGTSPLQTGVTDSNGEIIFTDITYGDYVLKETKAPSGYNIITEETTFSIGGNKGNNIQVNNKIATININNAKAETPKGTVEVIKKDSDSGKLLSGAKFSLKNADGTDSFYATATSDASGRVIFENVPYGDYILTETDAPYGYNPVPVSISYGNNNLNNVSDAQITLDSADLYVTVTDEQLKGSLTIKKIDSKNNAALADAIFTLTGADGTVIGDYTTGSDGTVTINNLTYGQYTIKEKKAPEYYSIDSYKEISVTIDSAQTEKTFTDTRLSVFFDKKAIDGSTGLSGATLEIEDSLGNTVCQWVTTDSLYEVFLGNDAGMLNSGSYKLIEVNAPSGYAIADPIDFTVNYDSTQNTVSIVSSDGEVSDNKLVLTMRDEHMGSVKLTKMDTAAQADGTHKLLPGAEFNLYKINSDNSKTKIGDTYTTDANGLITVDNLVYGSYVFVETKAPDSYIITTTETSFTINSSVRELTVYNTAESDRNGAIIVSKKDSLNNDELFGAEFELYMGDQWIASGSTDTSGKIIFKNIPYGTYTLKETKAPYNYSIVNSEITIEINENTVSSSVEFPVTTIANSNLTTGGQCEISVLNDIKKRDIYIKKTDSDTSNGIWGAGFALFKDASCTHKVYPADSAYILSDTDGYIKFTDISYGTYYLKEVKVPDYYSNDSGIIKVTIDDMTENLYTESDPLICTNTRYKVSFNKLAADTDGNLSGATISIENVSDAQIKKVFLSGSEKTFLLGSSQEAEGGSGYLTPGTYILKELSAPLGYLCINDIKFELSDTGAISVISGNTDEYSIDNTGRLLVRDYPCGDITIEKIDAENNSLFLNNAEFKIYKASDVSSYDRYEDIPAGVTALLTEVTGAAGTDGRITFKNLPYGDYAIFESAAPSGYLYTSNRYDVSVNETNKNISLQITNIYERKTGTIKIIKTDSDDSSRLLANAEFILMDENNNKIATASTDDSGELIFTVPFGTYHIKEITAPDGYSLSLKKVGSSSEYTVDETNNMINVTVSSDKIINAYVGDTILKGSLSIFKIDSKSGEPVKDAGFDLYKDTVDPSNLCFSSGTASKTAADGTLLIENLPLGNYILVETSCPDDYILPSSPDNMTDITIDDSKVITYTITNDRKMAPLTIRKVDSEDNNIVLAGAVYDLYSSKISGTEVVADRVIATAVTGDDGTYVFDNLAYGTYFLKEVSAPDKYGIDENYIKVTVPNTDVLNVITTKDVSDVIGKGKLTVRKQDLNTKDAILGVTFILSDDNNHTWEKTTDANGICEFDNLPYGYYVLKEEGKPDWYNYIEQLVSVNIAEANVNITVDNFRTFIQIDKLLSNSTEKITGAQLSITDTVTDKVFAEWITDGTPKVFEMGDGNDNTKLISGRKYTLTEINAPAGYLLAESVDFTIDESGNISILNSTNASCNGNTLIMYDAVDEKLKSQINISKLIGLTNVPLEGAVLTLSDEDGSEIETFTTTADAKQFSVGINEQLQFNAVYTLKEISAPEGYDIADSISFKILFTGEIELVSGGELSQDKKTLIMRDNLKSPAQPETTDGDDEPDDNSGTPDNSDDGLIDTGDHTPIGLIIFIMLASLAAIITYYIIYRRKEKDESDDEDE